MWGYGFKELFLRGGEVMWPILACSVVGLAVALERLLVFAWCSTSYRGLVRSLQTTLERRDVQAARQVAHSRRGPLARCAEAYLGHLSLSSEAREDIVGRIVSENVARLENRLHWLSIIGVLSPMLGLLGTVAGLVEAFNRIEQLGGQVQPQDLASGIWAALLTTVFGLVVALPSLAVYHVLENRVNTILLQAQWLVSLLNEWLHKTPAAHHGEQPDEPVADDEKLTTIAGA